MPGNKIFKDIWTHLNSQIEFTYFRENYGSRIDRIYAAGFKENFSKIWVKPVSFSDHSCVFSEIEINGSIGTGKFYWKLNVKLLELDNIELEFKHLWNNLISLKHKYIDLIQWWDLCAKKSIQRFFKKKGSRTKQA